MSKIKKIFLETSLTWKKVIILSIISGIITGLIPLINILDKTSIHNISVCFEMWVLLAMFIILNSKKPLEAGIKTFIFFLISQPLCYLVQVPFYSGGFQIFIYYKYWAILTFLTFPGAMIAWYVKNENNLSIIIFSVALFLLDLELCEHFSTMIKSFPYQILAVIFILSEIIMFILIIFKRKEKRIILYTIFILLLIPSYILNERSSNVNVAPSKKTIIQLEENETYILETKDENVDIEINDEFITAGSREYGEYKIVLKNSKGKTIELLLKVNEEQNAIIDIVDNNMYK